MITTTVLKILSVVGSIAGVLASQAVIPGVSEKASVTIIGCSALTFKIVDMVENAIAKAPVIPPTP